MIIAGQGQNGLVTRQIRIQSQAPWNLVSESGVLYPETQHSLHSLYPNRFQELTPCTNPQFGLYLKQS